MSLTEKKKSTNVFMISWWKRRGHAGNTRLSRKYALQNKWSLGKNGYRQLIVICRLGSIMLEHDNTPLAAYPPHLPSDQPTPPPISVAQRSTCKNRGDPRPICLPNTEPKLGM